GQRAARSARAPSLHDALPISHSERNIDFFREALVKATERHSQDVIAALAPALTPRYPSQLIQGVIEGLAIFLILVWMWRKPRKPDRKSTRLNSSHVKSSYAVF